MFSFEDWERSNGSQRRAFWAGQPIPPAQQQQRPPADAVSTYHASLPHLPGESTVIRDPKYGPGPRTKYQFGPIIPEGMFVHVLTTKLQRWTQTLEYIREKAESVERAVREAQDAFSAVMGPHAELVRLHAVVVAAVEARRKFREEAREKGWWKFIDEE